MLNTNRVTVYVVAGVYHGEIGGEVSRTLKMVYVKSLGPGTTVLVMQSSIKVVLGSETLTPVSGDASHVRHAQRSIATHSLVDVCRGTYRGKVGRVVACTLLMVYLHLPGNERPLRLLKTSVLEMMAPDTRTNDDAGIEQSKAAAAA